MPLVGVRAAARMTQHADARDTANKRRGPCCVRTHWKEMHWWATRGAFARARALARKSGQCYMIRWAYIWRFSAGSLARRHGVCLERGGAIVCRQERRQYRRTCPACARARRLHGMRPRWRCQTCPLPASSYASSSRRPVGGAARCSSWAFGPRLSDE